jgi:tRNA (guanine-N7-)-methyltransferase
MKTDPLRPLEITWEDLLLGGGVRAAFERPGNALVVEIGPGDDDFLLDGALQDPETNWFGIEYSRKRVRRLVRRAQQRAGAPGNLRIVWRPAADVVGPFLAGAGVRAVHLYFPDPWPKKHHHRYRLVDPGFVADLAACLEPDGEVRVATDHEEYAQEMAAAFASARDLENLLPPPGYDVPAEGERLTVFEQRWRAMGRAIHRLHLRRRTV